LHAKDRILKIIIRINFSSLEFASIMSPVFCSTQRPKRSDPVTPLKAGSLPKNNNKVVELQGVIPLVTLPDSQQDMFETYPGMPTHYCVYFNETLQYHIGFVINLSYLYLQTTTRNQRHSKLLLTALVPWRL